jgi:hypothetical protein
VIDKDTWAEYMFRHGYSQDSVAWYLAMLQGEAEKGARQPSRTDLEEWYKKKVISEDEWRKGMAELGYSPEQIDNYFAVI